MTVIDPDRPSPSPLFASDLRRHGGRTAVVADDVELTYDALADRVDAMADRLGDRPRLVVVEATNTVDALVAYLAGLQAGHPVVLSAGDTAVERLVGVYDPDVVVRGSRVVERRDGTAHDLHPDLALLLSTSGSTGSPKLVRLSHTNVQSNATAIATYLGLTPDDRAITTLPMQYCYGLSVINSHLAVGASVALTDLSVVDRCFWKFFDRARATSLAGVPHTFDLLTRVGFESMDLPTLRHVTQAGGRMSPDEVRRFATLGARKGWDLYVMYGQTEATARMAYLPPHLAAAHPETIGVPIPGGSFTVESPDRDGVGELVYRGPNVMLGYASRPADLALGPSLDELRTGDLGRVTADGLHEIVGRRSRIIKPFGLRIDLDHVERVLRERGVDAVCAGDDSRMVVAVDLGDGDRRAAVATASGLVSSRFALPPSAVEVVAGVPRLANGKPDYSSIVERSSVGDGLGRTPSSASPVHRAFVAVLGSEPDDGDTFVDLGGDSLSYVEMSVRLEQLLGALPVDWHTTPVGELAARQPAPRRRTMHRAFAVMDTTVLVRAIAIVLIVSTHAKLWRLPGGAHALLAIAGFNFARFQLPTAVRSMLVSVGRIALPSIAWIAVVAAVSDKYGWPNALLINMFVERPGDRWGYWFIEALVLILLGLTAAFSVPVVRRIARRWPFGVALGAVAISLVVRYATLDAADRFRTSRPTQVLWLFALGWAGARATTAARRAAVCALAAVSVPGFFGNTDRELLILLAIVLIVWVPTVAVPRPARRPVALVASASLYVYLVHYQVFPPLARLGGPMLAVAGSVLAGIGLFLLVNAMTKRRLGLDGGRPSARIRSDTFGSQAVLKLRGIAMTTDAGERSPPDR